MHSKVCSFLFLACFLSFAYGQSAEPRGAPFFSVEYLEGSGVVRQDGSPITFSKTGVFYGVEEAPGAYPLISGFRFADGRIVAVVGLGSIESERFLMHLRKIPIVSFNVAERIESVKAALQAAATEGRPAPIPSVRDGSKYRIKFDYKDVHIEYEAWNPGQMIEGLAPYDPDLANLN